MKDAGFAPSIEAGKPSQIRKTIAFGFEAPTIHQDRIIEAWHDFFGN